MKKQIKRSGRIGLVAACAVAAAVAFGCSRGKDPGPGAAQAKSGVLQQAPWMEGERWGMSPGEIGARIGTAPALQSESSDYYAAELGGRTVLSQYVFGTEGTGGERGLVRKIVYMANPKRTTYLQPLSVEQAQKVFGEVRASMDAICGSSSVVTQDMAVSRKLESQSRSVGDRVAAAEKELRALERGLEARRHELQRLHAGQKNRNALVAAGLLELEKPVQQAQRKLQSLKSEQNQIRMEIRAECAALPEKERPFHWESEWEGSDGTAALWLRSTARGTYLALSFTAPE